MPSTSDEVSMFRSIHKTVQDVQNALKQFDKNGNGAIDKSELTNTLSSTGGNFTNKKIDTIFVAADVNRNVKLPMKSSLHLCAPLPQILLKILEQSTKM